MSQFPTTDPYLPGHGDPAWHAVHYDLDLDYDLVGNRLSGTAVITVEALTDLDRLVLDLAHLQVKKVTVDGRAPAKHIHRNHRLALNLRHRIPAGERATVSIKYAGKPRPLVVRHHGDAGWEELDDGVIVAGQPHGAPTWFPCNDRVDDKAAYTISVTTATNYRVVANGTLVRRTRRGSGETWTFQQAAPMPSYLATVQIGRYDLVELDSAGGRVPMHAAVSAKTRSDLDRSFARQGEMLACFERLFGPYPFPSYTVVITDDDLEIPLESQSLSTFGSNFLTGEWEQVRLVAHELSHQWFGNAVTMRRMQDIWLHEGFACYAEWLWAEAGGYRKVDEWAAHHHARLTALPKDLVVADPGPELMFDDRVYKRGALTLHAVRAELGDEDFFQLLRTWVARFSGRSVETADFEALVAEVAGRPLTSLFDRWLRSRDLPRLPR